MPRNALTPPGVFEPDPTNPLTGSYSAADAADFHRQNLADTWTAVRDPATWQDAADQYRSAMLMGSVAPEAKGLGLDAQAMKVLRDMTPGFRAYHGSPHSFDQFSSDKIGTGEGAQAYGHGLYLADDEAVARSYRDDLTTKQPPQSLRDAQNKYNAAYNAVGKVAGGTNEEFAAAIAERDAAHAAMLKEQAAYEAQPKPTGHMYEVNVASDPAHFLDWDKPRDQLAPNVQAFAKEHYPGAWENAADGSSLYHGMAQNVMRERTVLQTMLDNKRLDGDMREFPTERAQLDAMANPYAYVSQRLQEAGIPGIRYLDGGSRAGGQGTRNHVIFDPATIAILRKYGIAGLMAGGGAAAASGQPQQ